MKSMREGAVALVLALVVIAGQSPWYRAEANDDATPGLTLSPSQGLSVRENSTATFTVRLNSEPRGNVRVSIAPPSNGDVKVPSSPLDFTPSNWRVAQRVTIEAVNDHDAISEQTTIDLSATGSGYNDVRASLALRVEDDDSPGLSVSARRVTIEEGSSGSFTVRLAAEPTATVTVNIAQPSNASIRISPEQLTFRPSHWDRSRVVDIHTVADDDFSDENAIIVLGSTGGDHEGYSESVSVTVIDKGGILPPPDLSVIASVSSITLNEGESGRFEVKLSSSPTANVRVNLILPDQSDVTLTSSVLIFTPLNWATEQVVEFSVGEDEDFVDDSVRIDLIASGGGYDDRSDRNATVEIVVIDNDSYGSALILSTGVLVLNEGESGSFTVRLSARPGAEVNVALSQPPNPDIRIDSDENTLGNQNSLIFTSRDWNRPQTVRVMTYHDNDAVDERAAISLQASGGGYTRITEELSISVIDDDPPAALVLYPSPDITVLEGGRGIFTIKLATQPSEEVTLTLIQPTNIDIRVDTDPTQEGFQNKLVFLRSNWNRVQAVIVSAADDGDSADNRTRVSIVAEGAEEYSGLKVEPTVISVESSHSSAWPVQSAIPAIAPPSAQDMTTVRLRCKSDIGPCDILLDCTAEDGTIYRGPMDAIPSMATRVLNTRDIVEIVGGDWSGKGRLFCSLRSEEGVSGQIWTRSGDAVLVNNTRSLRSASVTDFLGRTYQRVDIESIPSPRDSDLSNIRIRCEGADDCTDVVFECYEDDGTLHSAELGFIGRTHTVHLQTQELSSMIAHDWQGMTLACEVRSDHPFSVQVLTRTGGGGALVNNSATVSYPPDKYESR